MQKHVFNCKLVYSVDESANQHLRYEDLFGDNLSIQFHVTRRIFRKTAENDDK